MIIYANSTLGKLQIEKKSFFCPFFCKIHGNEISVNYLALDTCSRLIRNQYIYFQRSSQIFGFYILWLHCDTTENHLITLSLSFYSLTYPLILSMKINLIFGTASYPHLSLSISHLCGSKCSTFPNSIVLYCMSMC